MQNKLFVPMHTYLSALMSWHISVCSAYSSMSYLISCTRVHNLLDLGQRLGVQREINGLEAN